MNWRFRKRRTDDDRQEPSEQESHDRRRSEGQLTRDDDAVLRMLAGANFGPNAKLILPSGVGLGGDEAQALTSAYAPEYGPDRPR